MDGFRKSYSDDDSDPDVPEREIVAPHVTPQRAATVSSADTPEQPNRSVLASRESVATGKGVTVAVRVRPLHPQLERYQHSVIACGHGNDGTDANGNGKNEADEEHPQPYVEVARFSGKNAAGAGSTPASGAAVRKVGEAQRAIIPSTQNQRFFFDVVVDEDETQHSTYDALVALKLETALDRGESLTVMAYGQTASGKTYTMIGDDPEGGGVVHSPRRKRGAALAAKTDECQYDDDEELDPDTLTAANCAELLGRDGDKAGSGEGSMFTADSGILLRVLYDVFEYQNQIQRGDPNRCVAVVVSVVELYNNKLRDLLADHSLAIRRKSAVSVLLGGEIVTHEAGDSLIVQGNTHALVDSFESAQRWVAAAARNRMVAATKMNMASSRGHALYFIDVFQLRKRGGTSALLSEANSSRTVPDLDGLIRLRTSVLTYSGRAASRVTGTSAAGLMAPVVPAIPAPTGNRSIEQRAGQKAAGEMPSRSKTPTLGRAPSPSRGGQAIGRAPSPSRGGQAGASDGLRPRRASLGGGSAVRPSTDLVGKELPGSSSTVVPPNGEYVMEALTRISIIDLAGSERLKRVSVNDEVIVAETKFVNQSLSALGNVINALSNSDSTHVPFRSNKLTRLLRPSFIASKVVFIATISPAEVNAGESVCTLRFASFLKNTKEAVVTCTRSALATTLLINDVTNGERAEEEMSTDVRLAYLCRQPLVLPAVCEGDEKDSARAGGSRCRPSDSLVSRVSARKYAVDEIVRTYEKKYGDGWRADPSTMNEALAAVSVSTQVYTAGAMQKYLKQLQLSLSAWRVLQRKGLSELGVSLSRIMAAEDSKDAPEPAVPGLPSVTLSDVIVDLPSLKQYMAGCKERYMSTTLYKSPVMIKRWTALKQTLEKIYATSQRILIEEETAARLELTTDEVDWWGSMTVQESKEHAMSLVLRSKRRHGELKQARAQLRQKEAELIELTEPMSEEALRHESMKDSLVEKVRSLVRKIETRSELLIQNANTLKTMQYFLDREEEEMEQKEEAKVREELALTSRRRGSQSGLSSTRSSISKLPRQPPSARFAQRSSLRPSSEKEALPSTKPRATRSAVIHNPLFVHFEMLPTALPTREARVRTGDDVGNSSSRRSSTEETSSSSQSPQCWQEPVSRHNGMGKSPAKMDWLSWEVPGASNENLRNSFQADPTARSQLQVGSATNPTAKKSTVPGVVVVEYPKVLERDLTLMISPMSASRSLRSDSPLETQRGMYDESTGMRYGFGGGPGGDGCNRQFYLEERSVMESSEKVVDGLSRQSGTLLPHLHNNNFSLFQAAADEDVVNGVDPTQHANLTPPTTSCRTSPSCKTASNSYSALELLMQKRSPSTANINLSPVPDISQGVGGMLRVCGRNADVMFLMESCSASFSGSSKRRRSSRVGVGIILEAFNMEKHLSLLTQIAVISRRFQRTRSLLSTVIAPVRAAVPVLSAAQTPGKVEMPALDHSPRKQALLKHRQLTKKRSTVSSESASSVGTPQRVNGHRESCVEVPYERERYVSDARILWRMLSDILDSTVVDLTTVDELMGSVLLSTAGEDAALRQELLRRGWFSPLQVTDELLQLLTQDVELRRAYMDSTTGMNGTPTATPLSADSNTSPLNGALSGPPNPGSMLAIELIRSIQLLSLFTKCVTELRKRTTGRLKSIQSGMDGADDLQSFGSVCGKSFLVDLTQPTPSSPGATNDSFLGHELQQTDSDVHGNRSPQRQINQDGLLVMRGCSNSVNPSIQEDWVDERLDAILDDRRDGNRRSAQSSCAASSMGDFLDNGFNPSMTPTYNGWGVHSPNAFAGSLAEISNGVILLDADQLAQTGGAGTSAASGGDTERINGCSPSLTNKNLANSTNESIASGIQSKALFPTLNGNGNGGVRPVIRRGSGSTAPSTSPTYRSAAGGGDNESSIRADVLAETISCSTLEKQEIPKWRAHLKKTVCAYLARSAIRRSSIDAAAGMMSPKPVAVNVLKALEDTPAELSEDDRDICLWAFMCRLTAVS